MYSFLLFIGFLLFLNYYSKKKNIETYLNYQETSFQGVEKNCPLLHAKNYNTILDQNYLLQYPGYTKNELFDMTRYIETNIPLPVDPDFFSHI